MADYYPLLAKAVAGLPESTEEKRRAIYDRARKALIGQLRKIEPPIAEADIERENAALDEAVARLEGEIAGKAASEPPKAPAEESKPAAEPTPPAEAPKSPPAEAPKPPSAFTAPPPPRITLPPKAPAGPSSAPKPFSFRPPAAPAAAAEPPSALEEPTIEDEAPRAEPLHELPGDVKPLRPRETVRPAAPSPAPDGARSKRMWIVGGVVVAIVLLVAGLAFKLRDQGPQGLSKLSQTTNAPAETPSGKIVERADKPAATSGGSQSTTTNAAPGQAGQNQPPLPVAHRAALLIDAPDTPEKVKTYIGSVVWRLDSVPTGAGRPLGTAVHADVDIPEAKIRMSLDMQKNNDESLPASHTINVNFTILPGSEIPGIKQIGTVQMRREDASNGEALAGVPVQITDTAYLIGLARGDLVARNIDLLKNRGWLDLPLAMTSGKIAKFSLEKGASGARVINDAITSWEQEK